MDFFEHQERARRKTGLLVVYFVVAVALIIVVGLSGRGRQCLFYGQGTPAAAAPTRLWFPDVFAAVSLGTLAIIAVGSLYKIAELPAAAKWWPARSAAGPCWPTPATCASACC